MVQTLVSVVIPARNECGTIGEVVAALRKHPAAAEIIVVDSASTDATAAVAQAAGARVLSLDVPGFGRAVKAGFAAARLPWVFKLDGDMRNASPNWLSRHLELIGDDVGLVKAYWDNAEDPMPVTNLVVKPSLSVLIPELSFVRMPIAGIYLCNKALLKGQNLSDDYGHDLDLMIRIHRIGARIEQVYLGEVLDCLKPLSNYFSMARELLSCVHAHSQVQASAPMMLVMAHPDDAEIWCGGTISKVLNSGGIIEIWVATGNEERQAEALRLENAYGNARVRFLGGSEFEPFVNADRIGTLAEAISRLRPQTLITHHPDDDHPDHRACYDLMTGACMQVTRSALPASLYLCNSYFQQMGRSGGFAPDTFIDISNEAEFKYSLIRNHESQDVDHWTGMAQAMDALNGAKCGVKRAEAFQRTSVYCAPRPSHLLT